MRRLALVAAAALGLLLVPVASADHNPLTSEQFSVTREQLDPWFVGWLKQATSPPWCLAITFGIYPDQLGYCIGIPVE